MILDRFNTETQLCQARRVESEVSREAKKDEDFKGDGIHRDTAE